MQPNCTLKIPLNSKHNYRERVESPSTKSISRLDNQGYLETIVVLIWTILQSPSPFNICHVVPRWPITELLCHPTT